MQNRRIDVSGNQNHTPCALPCPLNVEWRVLYRVLYPPMLEKQGFHWVNLPMQCIPALNKSRNLPKYPWFLIQAMPNGIMTISPRINTPALTLSSCQIQLFLEDDDDNRRFLGDHHSIGWAQPSALFRLVRIPCILGHYHLPRRGS